MNYRLIESHCDGAAVVLKTDDRGEAVAEMNRLAERPDEPRTYTLFWRGRRVAAAAGRMTADAETSSAAAARMPAGGLPRRLKSRTARRRSVSG